MSPRARDIKQRINKWDLIKLKRFFSVKEKSTKIKRAWCWYKNRHIDQWNRTESPEINPSVYSQLIFDKEDRTIK